MGTQNVGQKSNNGRKGRTGQCGQFGPLFHFLCNILHPHPVQLPDATAALKEIEVEKRGKAAALRTKRTEWSIWILHRRLKYFICCLKRVIVKIHGWASRHSLGFEEEDWESLPGWRAATVATYCPSRLRQLPKFLSSKTLRMTGRPTV